MLNFIEKLQRAPESTRRLALYVILTICMAIVILIWLQTLDSEPIGVAQEAQPAASSPFDVVKQEWSLIWERLGGGLERIRDTFSQ